VYRLGFGVDVGEEGSCSSRVGILVSQLWLPACL
jgi:hypothetical protein